MTELVRNVRNAQAPTHPSAHLEEDTVVAVLNTIHEIVSDSLDNARSLLQARGVPALVALVASRWVRAGPAEGEVGLGRVEGGCRPLTPTLAAACCSQSVREAKAASHVLQTVWSYKELRGALQRDGWNKTRFQVQLPHLLSPFARTAPSRSVMGLTSYLCFVPP